jgi:hypothetical protein
VFSAAEWESVRLFRRSFLQSSFEDDLVKRLNRAARSGLTLALAASLAGCQEAPVGSIRANLDTARQLDRAISDWPPATATPSRSKSKSARRRPDYNDYSPRLRGQEVKP